MQKQGSRDDSVLDSESAKASAYMVGLESSVAAATTNMERVGWTMWMLTMSAALCGSLFGYDTG